jgi:selenocysteine lyase/cysteine desulfurase
MSGLPLGAFRARFPILGRRVYVNSCSQGALSTDVEEALGAFTASWHESGSPWDDWIGRVEALRTRVATAIGADPDEVAIVPSASAAVASIATALPFDGGRSGVVLGEFEFPTMAHAWLAQQPRGARVAWVKAADGSLPAAAYAAAIDERTRIVPVTHVSFRNGHRTDVAALTAICRERGALVFLDDYQRTGTGPIDVRALGVDFMVTGALKYLLGASGVAFLYVRRALIETLTPLVTGWFGRTDPFAFAADRLDWSATARRFEMGTPPVPNVYAALAGLGLLERAGLGAVERQIALLAGRFASGCRDRGFVTLTPAEPARRGPLVVLRARDAAALARRLEGRGIIASARGPGLRVSFHGYNTVEDVDAVLDALERESALLEPAGAAVP